MLPFHLSTMEETFRNAVKNSQIPGAALLATNKSGTFTYTKCFGRRGIDSNEQPLTLDTVMRFASATKLLTSIASLQCVERGLLHLDAPISTHLPELGALQLLTSFDQKGQPILKPPETAITLRHLLTHTSGLAYDGMSPLLIRYRQWQNIPLQPDSETVAERFTYPLIFPPSEGWCYGPGLDWAGKAIEHATNLSLEEYFQRYTSQPLGIGDMTFKLQRRPDMIRRRARTCDRDPEAGVLKGADNEFWHKDFEDDFGGMGIFTSPGSYFEVMGSLLRDDGKLLQPETVDLLFASQLSPAAEEGMAQIYANEQFGTAMGHLIPKNVRKGHALGGSLMMEDSEWRRKGTMVWGGLPNIIWSIDREAETCCLYASQVRPPGDGVSVRLAEGFERTMYAQVRDCKGGK